MKTSWSVRRESSRRGARSQRAVSPLSRNLADGQVYTETTRNLGLARKYTSVQWQKSEVSAARDVPEGIVFRSWGHVFRRPGAAGLTRGRFPGRRSADCERLLPDLAALRTGQLLSQQYASHVRRPTCEAIFLGRSTGKIVASPGKPTWRRRRPRLRLTAAWIP